MKRILGPKGGGFKNPVSAYGTLQGTEAMHALRKGSSPGKWCIYLPLKQCA